MSSFLLNTKKTTMQHATATRWCCRRRVWWINLHLKEECLYNTFILLWCTLHQQPDLDPQEVCVEANISDLYAFTVQPPSCLYWSSKEQRTWAAWSEFMCVWWGLWLWKDRMQRTCGENRKTEQERRRWTMQEGSCQVLWSGILLPSPPPPPCHHHHQVPLPSCRVL